MSQPEQRVPQTGGGPVCRTCPACKSDDVTGTTRSDVGSYCRCRACGNVWHDDGPAAGAASSWRQDHARLQARTDELKREHDALGLDKKPFDKPEHDAHNVDLQRHQADLRRHQLKPR